MSSVRILMSNIAYARGLSGSFYDQVFRAYRHVYCLPGTHGRAVDAIGCLVETTKPDVCCFVEIVRGRASGRWFNKIHELLEATYPFWDVSNKYFRGARSHWVPFLGRNCNAFCAKGDVPFERVYLAAGMKRLLYRISLTPRLTLFFTHLSLRRAVRRRQIEGIRALVDATPGDHVVMGDFNIFSGLDELAPLLDGSSLVLLNEHDEPTHRFHRRRRLLDVCLLSKRLRHRAELLVIEQGYSDHAALLLRLRGFRVRPKKPPRDGRAEG